MPRIGISTSGHVWVSKAVSGCLVSFVYIIFVVLGILGIAALIYSLT